MDLRLPQPSPFKKILLVSPCFNKVITHALFSLVLLLSLFTIIHYTTSFQPFSLLPFSFTLPHLSDGGREERCDYGEGRWLDDGGPLHYSEECPFLDPGFQCRRNGRKDTGYLQWRWQPRRCRLPRFNASEMLVRSRNKRILFVGDSIGRNQWESLVCMLWVAVANQSRVYEKNGNPISKHKGYLAILFHDYNLTVEYYRAPFLVVLGRPPPNTPTAVRKTIYLDTPSWYSSKWVGAEVVVFNTGHWWNHDKTFNQGNYFQINNALNMSIDIKDAYRMTIQTIKHWAVQNLHPKTNFVFFRSYAQSHYSNGNWDIGGSCYNESEPKAEGEKVRPEPWSNRVMSMVLQEIKDGKKKVGFLNITYLTELRADGHPSSHREPGTPVNAPEDCSHWCLPGVPDVWNEILYANLLSMDYGTRTNTS